jgi:hypothetical protein
MPVRPPSRSDRRVVTRDGRPARRRAAWVAGLASAGLLAAGLASARTTTPVVSVIDVTPVASEPVVVDVAEPMLPSRAAPRPRPVVRQAPALTSALKAKGWNACMMPDTGFGPYTRWMNVAMGQMIVPKRGGMTEDGGYDVVMHFHGHEAVRRALVQTAEGVVLVGIDLGVGSGAYEGALALAKPFDELLVSIERGLRKHSGNPDAHIRHLALSSWSAGYGAVVDVLRHHEARVDAVVLLDSLHSGYVKGPPHDMHAIWGVWSGPLAPVVSFARLAAKGEKKLWLTHSDVRPPGYAATAEVADFLLGEVGGVRAPMQGTTPLGAELKSGADLGGLSVRGYTGNGEHAHCAHTELLAEVVRDVLEPAWGTPAAER